MSTRTYIFDKYLLLICYDLTNDNYVLQNDIFMQELPERLLKNPSIVVTDKSSEAQMDPKQTNYASSPSVLDHLLVEEDVSPDNEELFAPDPETVPYLTAALLAEEKANDHFCKATEEKETTEDEGVENGSGSGDSQEDGGSGSGSGDYEDYEEEDGSGEGDRNNLIYDLLAMTLSQPFYQHFL